MSPRALDRGIAAALAILVIAVYGQVAGHAFVDYGDDRYVAANPHLGSGLGWEQISESLSSPYYGSWIPLTALSLQLGAALHGRGPAGFLLTNVALHAAASVLLYAALFAMTGARWRSAFAAGVFALHPLHVESVAWASARQDTLGGVFWTASLVLYARYAASPHSLRAYQLVAFCVAIGVLASPIVAALPLVLIALDFWPLARMSADRPGGLPGRRAIAFALREKLQLLTMVALVVAVSVGLRQEARIGLDPGIPLAPRLVGAANAIGHTLAASFWPRGLAVVYPPAQGPDAAWRAVAVGVLLVAITAAALRLARTRPYLLVGWIWFLVTLLPSVGIVDLGLRVGADRHAYLPLAGLAIAVSWAAADAARSAAARRAVAAAGAAALAALGIACFQQVRTWRDSRSLFEHALAVTTGNAAAHHGLARAEYVAGHLDEAQRHFARASDLFPDWAPPRFGLAAVLAERGDLDGAIAEYRRGLSNDPVNAEAHAGLGLALLREDRIEEARPHLELALQLGAVSAPVHAALALVYDRLGGDAAAVRNNREALRLDPGMRSAANNLAWVLATSPDDDVRDPEEAVRLAEALRAEELDEIASIGELDTLAAAYAAAGRFDDAVATAARAAGLAARSGQEERAERIRERLALYEAGRPYRDAVAGDAGAAAAAGSDAPLANSLDSPAAPPADEDLPDALRERLRGLGEPE